MDHNRKSSWALLVLVPYFSLIGWLAYLALTSPGEGFMGASDYIAILTLAVTIMGAVAGLFGLGALWYFGRIKAYVEDAKAQVKEAESRGKEIQRALHDAKTKVADLQKEATAQLQESISQADSYVSVVQQTAHAFYPTGLFLCEELDKVIHGVDVEAACPGKCGQLLKTLLNDLFEAFQVNAECASRTLRLFTSEGRPVRSAALYLGARSSPYTLEVLEQRLALEKAKANPDVDLVETLSRILEQMKM